MATSGTRFKKVIGRHLDNPVTEIRLRCPTATA